MQNLAYYFSDRSRGELSVYVVGPEDPGSIPVAVKGPTSAWGVRARKIRGSESPMVGR